MSGSGKWREDLSARSRYPWDALRLDVNGVYDNDFTAIDAASSDCTARSSQGFAAVGTDHARANPRFAVFAGATRVRKQALTLAEHA